MNIAGATICILTTICALMPLGITDSAVKSEETKTEPSAKQNTSAICTKCVCDVENSLIDCTNKLTDWFTDEEWKSLKNQTIVFESIKMEHNNLTTIPALPTYGVKNLYLGYNQIASITLGAFQNLTELTKLDLSNNKLTSKALVPDVFKGPYSQQDFEPLKNLKSLNLGYNLIHSLNDDLFEHLPYLEELSLSSNTFQVIDRLTETAVAGLSSLKVLDMSFMELSTLPDTILHGPRDLDTLILSGNLFKQVPKALSFSKNLKRLVLDENPIGNLEGENVFPAMTSLKYLRMAYMQDIYKIGPGAFSELQNLTELILSDNKMLTELDLHALSKNVTGGDFLDYPPLDKLYLNNCNLTTLPREFIVRWDKLSVLDLRFNPWDCHTSNEYMIKYLIPRVNSTTPLLAKNVKCEYPEELKGVEVLKIVNGDFESATQGSSLVWIGIIIAILLAIPLILAGMAVYKRGHCRLCKKNEAANRTLYSRTSFNEDFHI
ncbi:PREDICTED: leucine-rich repeat-containing protein 15 [Drosophila arizonae]|uniref:Leucine-rich repeat-containing protein 15 n=1 Tax=Drosophila arizonae TaxID=7263 RepID=A0ABM1NSR8_DROAR|nr:PREDICTED: leucine-rich repeat-containing protein 15 [Drosophila arizonae]